MIVKGYIEELLPPNQARVRMPDFDGEYGLSNSVDTADLNIATVSTAFGIYPNLKIGDEVYVSFLNHRLRSPVILGRVYDASNYTDIDIAPDAHLKNLQIISTATLPKNTTIGDITYKDLEKLKNIQDNIQNQLNDLNQPLYDQEIECSIENYAGSYDGEYHTCVCKTSQPLSFLYSEDGETYQSTPLTYKRAGTYKIFIKAILGFRTKIYEGTVDIVARDILITVQWGNTNFIEDGSEKSPAYTLNGIVSGDDVEVNSIKYYSYNISGERTPILRAPTQAGVYAIEIESISGEQAENYNLDVTTASCTFVIDQVSQYDWGIISNTISTYTAQNQSIKIEG